MVPRRMLPLGAKGLGRPRGGAAPSEAEGRLASMAR